MALVLSLAVGLLVAASVFLILSRNLIRLLLGTAVLSNAVNLLIFGAGRITREVPPLIPPDASEPLMPYANPLPQALILTAIVISFSLFAFLLVLVLRTWRQLGTLDAEALRAAEPEPPATPGPPS